MKNNKIKILATLAVISTFVVQFSSCDSVSSDFKEVLGIVENKTLKGGSKMGLLSGRSLWKFDGTDLAIMYSAKMNTTMEKTILDNGDEEWTKEEYSIENLEPSYVYDETKNIVRKVMGVIGVMHDLFIQLKPKINPTTKQLLQMNQT